LARDLGGLIKVTCTIILVLGEELHGRGIILYSFGGIVSSRYCIVYSNDLVESTNLMINSEWLGKCRRQLFFYLEMFAFGRNSTKIQDPVLDKQISLFITDVINHVSSSVNNFALIICRIPMVVEMAIMTFVLLVILLAFAIVGNVVNEPIFLQFFLLEMCHPIHDFRGKQPFFA